MNKKTISGKLLIAMLSVGLVFTGCSKDDGETTTPTPTPTPTPGNPTPTPADAGGVWTALIVSSKTPGPIPMPPVELSVGTGGHFGSSTSSFVDAGAVTVNTNTLKKTSNNAYIWNGTSNIWTGSNPQAAWTIEGKGAVPAYSYTTTKGFPIVGEISSSSDVTVSDGHTITLTASVANADSIIIVLTAGSKSLTKVIPNVGNSFDLSSTELSGFSGSGIIQVAAYNWEIGAGGGGSLPPIYFINEKVVMQNIKATN
ncbi:MAG TPA: hypothetical protein VK202_01525 [Bacteroidia bacterium]|nr:hypothetical protein [Bacteroidia bacterium]